VKIVKGICLLMILAGSSISVYSIDLEEFSENKKLYVFDVSFVGNNILSEKELFELSGYDRETGLFVKEIKSGIDKLKKSGYFSAVNFMLTQGEKGYKLEVTLKENPPLASLKVLDSKMLDLTVFRKKLKENNVITDMVFSQVMLQKAIDSFNIYNQNYGIFMYIITFKAVNREEIIKSGGVFLYDPDELKKSGVHVIVQIRDIPKMVVGTIGMKGVSISYDKILGFIKLKQGMPLSSDKDLFFCYKRMKKLGFYEKVYFRIIPQEDIIYGIEIVTDEITLSEITSSLTAPQNIGVIMTAEYYDISVAKTLQRLRFGAGWEIQPGAPVFVAEYTHPYFFEGLFVDVMFSKYDNASPILESTDMKLRNIYEGKFTTGINVAGNFFSYLYHKETYSIQQTVDNKFEKIEEYPRTKEVEHSSGIMLVYDDVDDNFFITQGYKLVGDYETMWRKKLAYKTGVSGEIYIPVPFFNMIAAVNSRSNFLIIDKSDTTTTLQTDDRMRTSVQVLSKIGVEQIRMTTYSSGELRFPLPQGYAYLEDMSFVLFGEAGGAWSEYNAISLQQTKYGFGIGLRLSPRKHYSSFLFQFPAGLYIGYRVGDTRVKPTLVSHRDKLYYISLSAGF
jgi:hypothetical protein